MPWWRGGERTELFYRENVQLDGYELKNADYHSIEVIWKVIVYAYNTENVVEMCFGYPDKVIESSVFFFVFFPRFPGSIRFLI